MSTVRIYRIVHRKYADLPFSGEGGLYTAGRWSHKGRLISYASDSLALAAFEQLVRLHSMTRLRELVYVTATLSLHHVQSASIETLPDDWDAIPPTDASRRYGDEWLDTVSAIALRVPSVILPRSYNFVLNPVHPEYDTELLVDEAKPLTIDQRIERLISAGRESTRQV